MSLTLYYHPLSSFCHKALIGLYELDVPFEKYLVAAGDEAANAALRALWPIGKFPVIRDEARGQTIPESTILLEYLDRFCVPEPRLIPTDPERALECRLRDRFYDLYIHMPMQTLVGYHLRPEDQRDPLGAAHARKQIETAYAIANEQLREGEWAMGDAFTLVDCAAAPALFYANKVVPFAGYPHLVSYFARLCARPSYARVLEEAKPYMHLFPVKPG
jgi:glutathione S-transferase